MGLELLQKRHLSKIGEQIVLQDTAAGTVHLSGGSQTDGEHAAAPRSLSRLPRQGDDRVEDPLPGDAGAKRNLLLHQGHAAEIGQYRSRPQSFKIQAKKT